MTPDRKDALPAKHSPCSHRYLTAYPGSGGWVCAACRVPILSLALPIPVPLVAQALMAVAGRAAITNATQGEA
jgi:hypothetical protein